ncbi:hypothetical protein RDI58_000763 [Solanum bulbocastanum]|uniref:Uncharacterized protein n=1 Tax=Solanum bulbocastanum TaxID=147425 RepID=A0AAN8YPF3_SOLBU
MTTPFCCLIEEICVFLVHHGTKFVTEMTDLLESNEYKGYLPKEILQNIGDSSLILPNGHVSEYDQVYYVDQVAGTPSVQFQGIAKFPK